MEPRSGNPLLGYDAYEYTAHSHTFLSDDTPSAKVTFDLSPIQVRASGREGFDLSPIQVRASGRGGDHLSTALCCLLVQAEMHISFQVSSGHAMPLYPYLHTLILNITRHIKIHFQTFPW